MKVAVLGYGTVGVGVHEMLRSARGLEPGPVLVRPGKERESFHCSSISEILSDPSVEAVVEVMGGTDPAYSYAMQALESGRHFVTANKVLCAEKGLELAAAARKSGAAFLFSAACGGAIPFLHNLSLATAGDEILSVSGILNGTTNFILDLMQSEGGSYEAILERAKELGYAEADPTADVSGMDALRKILLASAVAFSKLPASGALCEGIENFTAEDAYALRSHRLVCRLIAGALPAGDSVAVWVEPTLFPAGAPERSVRSNYNMAKYTGTNCGPMCLIGQGAGRFPTASAVLRDLESILRGGRVMMPESCRAVAADSSGVSRRYYVRLPAGCAGAFPFAESSAADGVLRGITEKAPIGHIHAAAAELRAKGEAVFFAALSE